MSDDIRAHMHGFEALDDMPVVTPAERAEIERQFEAAFPAIAITDGMAYYLTTCCGASAKGSGGGVCCRSCYQEVEPWMGDAAMTHDAEGMARLQARVATD